MAELESGVFEKQSGGNGIAIGGLVTAIAAAVVAVGDAVKSFGGGGKSKAELRDENILLQSELKNNDLKTQLARQEEQIRAMRDSFSQAMFSMQQYADASFVRAEKCIDSRMLNPPAMGAFGVPTNFQVAPVPVAPFYNPYVMPPQAFAAKQSSDNSGSGSGGSGSGN